MRVRCFSVGCASLGASATPRMSPNGTDHSTSAHSGFSRSPSIVSGGASAASRRATYCRGASFQCGVKGESAGTGGCSALGRRDDVVAMATVASIVAPAKLPNTLVRVKRRDPSGCIARWRGK